MTFDELRDAVVSLPAEQRIQMLYMLADQIVDDDDLTPEQKADLLERERELEANPNLGEDGDVVLARLRANRSHVAVDSERA